MSAPIGLVPAAGRGLRFGGSGYDKELFPLLTIDGNDVRLRPICELSLEAIANSGAERCVVVVSPHKGELMRVLSALERPRLAFVVQPEPRGLPAAIKHAQPWLGDDNVVMALPDTIVLPRDALPRVHAQLVASGADLVLGVLPVDEPERLGPVEVAGDGRVLRVFDKPGTRTIMNSWGLAAWSPRFTRFCSDWETARSANATSEGVLGHVFAAAIEAGLSVRAELFSDGRFCDIGTPGGLRLALRELADRALVDAAQANPLTRDR